MEHSVKLKERQARQVCFDTRAQPLTWLAHPLQKQM